MKFPCDPATEIFVNIEGALVIYQRDDRFVVASAERCLYLAKELEAAAKRQIAERRQNEARGNKK